MEWIYSYNIVTHAGHYLLTNLFSLYNIYSYAHSVFVVQCIFLCPQCLLAYLCEPSHRIRNPVQLSACSNPQGCNRKGISCKTKGMREEEALVSERVGMQLDHQRGCFCKPN